MGIKIPPKIKEFTGKIFTKEKLPIILLFGIKYIAFNKAKYQIICRN